MTDKTPTVHADGVYFDLPMQAYLDDPALGSSDIKNLIVSPLTYWANSALNPDRQTEEETDATTFGTWLHEAIFEPEKRTFVTKPEGMSFATKDGKAWRQDQWDAEKTILTPKQSASMRMILLAVEKSGLRAALDGVVAEVSYFWTDPSGHRCKIRIDGMTPTLSVDAKTYANTMDKDLETVVAHAVANYRYHVSGFWYRLGIEDLRARLNKGLPVDLVKAHSKSSVPTDAQFAMLDGLKNAKNYPHWYCFLEKDGVPNVVFRQFVPNAGGVPNEYWRAAAEAVAMASNIYATNMEKFGSEIWMDPTPWKPFVDEEFGAASWIYR